MSKKCKCNECSRTGTFIKVIKRLRELTGIVNYKESEKDFIFLINMYEKLVHTELELSSYKTKYNALSIATCKVANLDGTIEKRYYKDYIKTLHEDQKNGQKT